MEGFRDCDAQLTPEQRVAKAAIIQEKNRVYQDAYQKNLRANPIEKFIARRNNANKMSKPKTKARQQEAIRTKRYHCDCCNVSCRDAASLRRHKCVLGHGKSQQTIWVPSHSPLVSSEQHMRMAMYWKEQA
jgi:hypothetical protein